MKGVVCVVLAAGKGERQGGPKALLEWPGKGPGHVPLAIAHAEARLAAESERVMVVVRKTVMPALLGFAEPGVDLVVSEAADELGPAGSLAVAVGKLADETVVVTPVDTPPARAETVAALLDALRAGAWAARPRHGTRAGHPVVMTAEALKAYRGGGTPPVLREHLRALGARCVDVDVDDPGVLVNLNTPADVAAFRGTAFRG